MWWPFKKKDQSAESPQESARAIVASASKRFGASKHAKVLGRTPLSITFAVDEVDPVLSQLASTDATSSWQSRGISQIESIDVDPLGYREAEPMHGLVAALHCAYKEHRPFALSPQDVWLCVLQAIARQVEANGEKFRTLFVSHQGKESIVIRRDSFRPKDPSNDWGGAITELSAIVQSRTSDRAKAFLPPPETAPGSTMAIACDVALLGAMQNFFELTVHTLCGIPRIRLEGSSADWTALRARTTLLDELELGDWRESLDAVIEQCISASRAEISLEFWREIYKREMASGGEKISGWINVLFPFLGDKGVDRRNPLATFGKHWPQHALEAVSVRDISPGLTSAPFNWKILATDHPMSFVAGFVGVTQDGNGTLRSRVGWAVTERVGWRKFLITPQGTWIPGTPSVHIRQGELLEDLQGISSDTAELDRWTLELAFHSTLRSLNGLESAKGLVGLSCLSLDIESLEPVRAHPTLAQLRIQQCDRLSDLSVIASLPSLKVLAISHCNSVRDWSALLSPACDQLEELALFGESVPRGLAGVYKGHEMVQQVRSHLAQKLGRGKT